MRIRELLWSASAAIAVVASVIVGLAQPAAAKDDKPKEVNLNIRKTTKDGCGAFTIKLYGPAPSTALADEVTRTTQCPNGSSSGGQPLELLPGIYDVIETSPSAGGPWTLTDIKCDEGSNDLEGSVTDGAAGKGKIIINEGSNGGECVLINKGTKPRASLTIQKSADPTTFKDGEEITYKYIVTNPATSTATVTDISVKDDKITDPITCLTDTLAPGAQTTCTATYTATSEDFDQCTITNKASARGKLSTGTNEEVAQISSSPSSEEEIESDECPSSNALRQLAV